MGDEARVRAVREACARLEGEPLWHASLGSKELFHSNLLGWALERWPDVGREVLGPWLRPGRATSTRVRREDRHLDLLVEYNGCEPVVVENKAFALPDHRQLTDYARIVADTSHGQPVLLLLSLTDPGWADGEFKTEHGTWQHVSYRQLGRRLVDAFAREDSNTTAGHDGDATSGGGFAREVMAHHGWLMVELADLMDLVAALDHAEPLGVGGEVHEVLQRARIADAVGKARAHRAMALIRERLDERGVPATAWDHEVGFSNGSPLLAAFWQAGQDRVVGWQFQNHQWRLVMILGDLGGRAMRARREALALAHYEYFDFGRLQQALGAGHAPDQYANHGRMAFNAFEPAFVYRYRKVAPATPLGTLVELAIFYSERAAEWAESITWQV